MTIFTKFVNKTIGGKRCQKKTTDAQSNGQITGLPLLLYYIDLHRHATTHSLQFAPSNLLVCCKTLVKCRNDNNNYP